MDQYGRLLGQTLRTEEDMSLFVRIELAAYKTHPVLGAVFPEDSSTARLATLSAIFSLAIVARHRAYCLGVGGSISFVY